MPFLTGLYAFLFYFAALVLVSELTYKVVQYSRTPTPLKIPTTPAPTTRGDVVLRMTRLHAPGSSSARRAIRWTTRGSAGCWPPGRRAWKSHEADGVSATAAYEIETWLRPPLTFPC